jgi:multidrug efflux pump subunit AcrB
VALGSVATLTRASGPSVLRRADGTRRVRVSCDLDSTTTSSRVNQALQASLADVPQRYPGGRLHFGGEFQQTQESFASLFKAFWIALIAIYTILGVQFRSFSQPLVVLGAVPLCFVGVVIGLIVTGSPFGMIAGIGVVALAGIVVNDSLVLVDFINGRRRRGVPLIEAVVSGGRERLRPILLTTITTVAGLLPLGLGWGGENPLLAPMATSVSWGLAFATGLTLVVVPCLYVLVDRLVLRLTGSPTVSADDDGLDDLAALRADLRPEA